MQQAGGDARPGGPALPRGASACGALSGFRLPVSRLSRNRAACHYDALGLVRLGDIYQRMHGAGIVDTGGAGLILFGLLMLSPDWTVTVRLLLIGFVLVMTSPTATHAIARAARVSDLEAQLGDSEAENGADK